MIYKGLIIIIIGIFCSSLLDENPVHLVDRPRVYSESKHWNIYSDKLNDGRDGLILFTQSFDPIITSLEIEHLDSLAAAMDLEFILMNMEEGVPDDVTTVPSLYYFNKEGRSKYYGRYNNIFRVKNFIRTSSLSHQKNASNPKVNILSWKNERSLTTAPLKYFELEGVIPEDYTQDEFYHKMPSWMANGMNEFSLSRELNADKNTKSLYINVYPYRDSLDNFSITTELFSQYNCIKPIFSHTETSYVLGTWKGRKQAFKEFGQKIELEILNQILSSTVGDAYMPVPLDNPKLEWSQLGISAETSAAQNVDAAKYNKIIPREWQVEELRDKDVPIIIFSFLSPVDNYSGEVKNLQGEFSLPATNSLKNATGKFTVSISDVTMGSKDFDLEIQNKMLKMGLFPDAQYEFTSITAKDQELQVGKTEKFEVNGDFTMVGITIPLTVDTQIKPIINDLGDLRLLVSCQFEIPLFDKFKIKGPDGPSPAKDRLQFFMKFKLEAKHI